MKYQKMAENILLNLKAEQVHRIDVNFQINTKFISFFIHFLNYFFLEILIILLEEQHIFNFWSLKY